jgi:hypothetical protein
VTFGGLSAIALFFIAQKREPASAVHVTARNFVIAGVIVVLVNVVTVNFLPVTIIIQNQITRVGLWIMILAYLYFANYMVRKYQERAFSPRAFYTLLACLVFSPTPVLVLIVWSVVRTKSNPRLINALAGLTAVAILTSYVFVWNLGFWNPGIYLYGQNTPWVQVQDWARTHTSRDARFITPPERWGVQESDWRVHSERSSAATFSELLVAAFQPGYETEWKPRFELVAPGALARFDGDVLNNFVITRQAYNSLSTPDLINATCRLNAQYIVSEKPYLHDLPQVYENQEFVVYDARGISCIQ